MKMWTALQARHAAFDDFPAGGETYVTFCKANSAAVLTQAPATSWAQRGNLLFCRKTCRVEAPTIQNVRRLCLGLRDLWQG